MTLPSKCIELQNYHSPNTSPVSYSPSNLPNAVIIQKPHGYTTFMPTQISAHTKHRHTPPTQICICLPNMPHTHAKHISLLPHLCGCYWVKGGCLTLCCHKVLHGTFVTLWRSGAPAEHALCQCDIGIRLGPKPSWSNSVTSLLQIHMIV